MAGYSGTPLPKKLGIKPGHRVALVAAPSDFALPAADLPEHVVVRSDLRGATPLDVILFFTKRRAELERRFAQLKGRITPAGGLWISWPKKSSRVETDVDEALVRATGLGGGLVDNKICAVDETWSGLRFVWRLEDRPKLR